MRQLKQIILSLLLLSAVQMAEAQIVVEAGNVQSLLKAIEQANVQNADVSSKRLFVLIPNGYYDLGELTLTPINGHNISLLGESTEGVIIRNAPKVENEGIGKTAVFVNRGQNNYVQDLTLRNDLDFYHSGAAGRAVCWQDKGNYTIFNRVRLLSYQDTYYSHSEMCYHYMVDSEIHGTLDFICGAGDVFFDRCLIVTEKRTPDGSGTNVIAAPRTSETFYGFVFSGCTVRNDVSPFTFARGWHTHPRCVWLNTTLETPEKLEPTRFDPYGIRSVVNEFKEYHTMDAQGRDVTPASNPVTMICKTDTNVVETIMAAQEAPAYTVKKVFPKWRPDKKVRRLERQGTRMRKKYLSQRL